MSWEIKYKEAITASNKPDEFNKKLKRMYNTLKLSDNGGLEIKKELSDTFIRYANHYINRYKNNEFSTNYPLNDLYKEFERLSGQN